MRRASGDVLVGTIVMYVGVGLAHRGTGDGSMVAEQVAPCYCRNYFGDWEASQRTDC